MAIFDTCKGMMAIASIDLIICDCLFDSDVVSNLVQANYATDNPLMSSVSWVSANYYCSIWSNIIMNVCT